MEDKKAPDEFSPDENRHRQKIMEEQASARQEIESRIRNIHRCFEEVILPAVYSVENDLKQGGYGYRITIGRLAEYQEPFIREVVFHFYPDRTASPEYTQKALDAACSAAISASGDYRKLLFSIRFPRRLPPVVETEEVSRPVGDIRTPVVDAFLEKFIKGAIDVHLSDRVLL